MIKVILTVLVCLVLGITFFHYEAVKNSKTLKSMGTTITQIKSATGEIDDLIKEQSQKTDIFEQFYMENPPNSAADSSLTAESQ